MHESKNLLSHLNWFWLTEIRSIHFEMFNSFMTEVPIVPEFSINRVGYWTKTARCFLIGRPITVSTVCRIVEALIT